MSVAIRHAKPRAVLEEGGAERERMKLLSDSEYLIDETATRKSKSPTILISTTV